MSFYGRAMIYPRRRGVKLIIGVAFFGLVLFTSLRFTEFAKISNYPSEGTNQLKQRDVTVSAKRHTTDNPNTGNKRHDEIAEDIRRISSRKKTLEEFCEKHSGRSSFLNSKIPFLSASNHFLFCPLAKCASTFWNRFVITLNTSGGAMASPFEVPLSSNALRHNVLLSDLGSQENRIRFLQNSLKVIFVRDPYHRTFSAYVDKVFAPNPYYWREWSTMPGQRRNKADMKRVQTVCHHDLKFADVVSAVVRNLHKSELHFVPMFRRCQPCEFGYDVIGKMETLGEDLRYLSNHMNLSLTEYFASDSFRYDYAKDAIEDSINSPFGWLKDIYTCMDKFEMGLRIWRKLQIRGLVDRRFLFPYSADDFQHVTAKQFIDVSLKAHQESTDREELRQQKKDAFIEAYRSVDPGVLDKLKALYKDDFVTFGYQSSPADVFDTHRKINVNGAFDWWKPWTSE